MPGNRPEKQSGNKQTPIPAPAKRPTPPSRLRHSLPPPQALYPPPLPRRLSCKDCATPHPTFPQLVQQQTNKETRKTPFSLETWNAERRNLPFAAVAPTRRQPQQQPRPTPGRNVLPIPSPTPKTPTPAPKKNQQKT